MKKKTTGTDVAHYVSLAAMAACVVGVVCEIVQGTYDFGMWILFFAMEALCYRSTVKHRKQKSENNGDAD